MIFCFWLEVTKILQFRPFPDVLEERVFCDSENVYCNLREEVEACASSASEANQEENGAAAVSCEYDFIAKDEKIYDSIMAHKPTKPVSTVSHFARNFVCNTVL